MLEDSILPSPGKSNKSIRNVREVRRCKRKLSSDGTKENKPKKKICLQYLYQDSSDDENPSEILNKTFLTGSCVHDYIPFEMEGMLIKADRRVSLTSHEKRNDLLHIQGEGGFLTCQRLTAVEQSNDMDGSFVITDTELLNCCNEADEMIKTPQKELRLVNAILEDFSLSPLTTTKPPMTFWEYSPEFILKSIPTKTYSRTNRTDFNKRLELNETINLVDGESVSNNSSNISIEENNSQIEDMFNTTVIPDLTETLSGNLLNLSAFYRHGEPSSNTSRRNSLSGTLMSVGNESDILVPNNVADLLQEICSLRKRSRRLCRFNSFNSDEELYGFSYSESDDIEPEISLSEDCRANGRLDETLLSPQSFHIPDEDREMVLCPGGEYKISHGFEPTKEDEYQDEWNDDCPEVFAFIKTQEVLLQQKNPSLQNNTSTPKIENSQNCIGFKTTLSKSIYNSKDTCIRSWENCNNLRDINEKMNYNNLNKRTILNSFEPRNGICIKENQNQYDDMPSTSKAAARENIESVNRFERNFCNNDIIPNVVFGTNTGFHTAKGKKVNISTKAQKTVEKLLKEFHNEAEQGTDNLHSIKNKINHKNSKLSKADLEQTDNEGKKELWEDDIDIANVVFSEWPLEEQLQSHSLKLKAVPNFEKDPAICYDMDKRLLPLKCNAKPVGFQTAGGKKVEISAKAQKVVADLLQEIKSDSDTITYEQNLVEVKSKILAKNYELNATKSVSAEKNTINSMSDIRINDDAPPKTLQLKAALNFEKDLMICYDVDTRMSPLKCNTKLVGFRTAGGKKVAISAKAQNVVANLLHETKSDCDITTYEQNLIEIKSKMLAKNCELNNTKPVSAENNSVKRMGGIIMNGDSPSNNPNVSYHAVELKRSMDSSSTPLPPSKKCLLKMSFSELSVRSPLNTSATKSIISRKNLLSLSKKRKQKDTSNASNNSTRKVVELEENPGIPLEDHAETPIKMKPSSASQTPRTPNINEFFNNASKSSTPLSAVYAKPAEMEKDFKPISWDGNNTSISKHAFATKLLDDTCSNITLNSSNPTVNDRIGRLQMYGNAPAISPILIDTRKNCRPSGLRRTRSSKLKKSANI